MLKVIFMYKMHSILNFLIIKKIITYDVQKYYKNLKKYRK